MSKWCREATARLQYHDLKTLPEQVLLGMRWGYEEERAGSVWLAVDVAIPAVIGRFGNHAAESRTLWTVRQQLNTQVPVQDGNKRARMHPMKPYTLTVSYCTYPWFKAMTKTHVFKTSVRVWTNGVCVKHARKNSLQRRSLFSVANHSTAAHAKKHNLTLLSRTRAMLFIMLLYPNSCRVMKHDLKMPNGTQRNKFSFS